MNRSREMMVDFASAMRQFATLGIVDALVVVVSYAATLSVRVWNTSLEVSSGFYAIAFAAIITPFIFYAFHIYHCMWEHSSGAEVGRLFRATVVVTAVVFVFSASITPRPLPLSVVLFSLIPVTGGVTVVRYRRRVLSGFSWRWKAVWKQEFPAQATRVLIMGAGESGQLLAVRLKRHPNSHGTRYTIVGFVDDDPKKQRLYLEGYRVLGTREQIPDLVDTFDVDLIAIAIHKISSADFRDILSYCEKTSARIMVLPDVLDAVKNRHSNKVLRDVQLEDLIGRHAISKPEGISFEHVENKVILVTGAAGSIGSELCRQMVNYNPSHLLLLDNNESGLYDIEADLRALHPKVRMTAILADITHEDSLRQVFTEHRPQVIFHAAAYKHVPMLEQYPAEGLRVNIGGTINLALLAMEYQVARFILISTDKAIKPISVMGASKRLCEELLRSLSELGHHETLFASVRFGNVLGSRGSVVPLFTRQIEAGGPVTVTHPDMTRYFLSIPEAANLVIAAACLTAGGDTYLLKMGESVRIVDLAERMIRLRGMRPGADIEITYTGVRPGEKIREELFNQDEEITETTHPYIVKIKGDAVAKSDGLLEGLRRLVDHSPALNGQALDEMYRLLQLESETIQYYNNGHKRHNREPST
ncbi:MAG: polysaccharide biosynthesis protein [Anaerolineae bacterium]|nr:polysaccharide biosynthesis protein [Anaerolineae bacterium]